MTEQNQSEGNAQPEPSQTPPKQSGAGSPTIVNDPVTTSKQGFLWHTLDYLGDYARFADTKAAFAGTLAGALLGCLYGAGLFAPLVRTPIREWAYVSWMTGLAGVLLCVSIGLAVHIVYPRLKRTGKTGFIFWGGIAAYDSGEKFKAAFRANSETDLNEALQGQVFDVAKYVLVPKYKNVSHCLRTLVIGASFAGLALLAKDASSPKSVPVPVAPIPAQSSIPAR